jgi:hypothetical protein
MENFINIWKLILLFHAFLGYFLCAFLLDNLSMFIGKVVIEDDE